MELSAFTYSLNSGVARITLNQSELGNPFNQVFCEEFKRLSVECSENPEVRSVLISAAGKNFSVGGDLKTFLKSREQLPRAFMSMTSDLHMGVSRFSRMDAPVVIAVHHLVVGGAVALVAAADFAIASESAQFYAAFTAIGLCGDTGISYFLPRRVGSRRATEFLMLNQKWAARTALENGLINEVVEEDALPDRALALATQLAQGPTRVLGKIKRLQLSSYQQALETQLEFEARAMTECAYTEDAWNAMNALAGKQPVRFENK
jgi:2-(1,2-epoxy-1,2-dihydrophenyl)acetyl-CoA isomerase